MSDQCCLICSSTRLHYAFSLGEVRVISCDDCGLMSKELSMCSSSVVEGIIPAPLARAGKLLDHLGNLIDPDSKILFLARDRCSFTEVVLGRNARVRIESVALSGGDGSGASPSPDASCWFSSGPVRNCFDYVILDEVVCSSINPRRDLQKARQLLKPQGHCVLVTRWLDENMAEETHLTGRDQDHHQRYFFDHRTLETILVQEYFVDISMRSIELTDTELMKSPGTIVALARRGETRTIPLLSVIIPVFNEAQTVTVALETIGRKKIRGAEIEIIVVESNSTDGTREKVLAFKDNPRFKVILEDRPRGKGSAVRKGLEVCQGEFILIQDADSEYDHEDYDALLEPLLSGREAFVLGARHGGKSWKIRKFNDQPMQAAVLNFAHIAFTEMLNWALHIKLKDPFTMYKVFRRECLHGVTLECNRFDFDWEILIKLVRKGYIPLEIPVNYRSRSFKEGKKVSILRDPITWMVAFFKYAVLVKNR